MNQTEIIMLCLSFLAGLGVGTLFFMGLWWTVIKRLSGKHTTLVLLGSFLCRAVGALAIFYFVAHEHPLRLIPILLGFLLAKTVIVRIKSKPSARIDEHNP